MLPYRDSKLTRIVLGAFFLLVILYAYYEARGIVYGPSVEVPQGVQVVTERFIVIEGVAARIAELSMNGRPISVTEAGAFSEPYVLTPGLNRIIFDATDRYGKTTQEVVEIVYQAPTASTSPVSIEPTPSSFRASTTRTESPAVEAPSATTSAVAPTE